MELRRAAHIGQIIGQRPAGSRNDRRVLDELVLDAHTLLWQHWKSGAKALDLLVSQIALSLDHVLDHGLEPDDDDQRREGSQKQRPPRCSIAAGGRAGTIARAERRVCF
jgi:hypothetical protein